MTLFYEKILGTNGVPRGTPHAHPSRPKIQRTARIKSAGCILKKEKRKRKSGFQSEPSVAFLDGSDVREGYHVIPTLFASKILLLLVLKYLVPLLLIMQAV